MKVEETFDEIVTDIQDSYVDNLQGIDDFTTDLPSLGDKVPFRVKVKSDEESIEAALVTLKPDFLHFQVDNWYTHYAVKYSMIKDCRVEHNPLNKGFHKNCCVMFQTSSHNLININTIHICKKFTEIESSLPL